MMSNMVSDVKPDSPTHAPVTRPPATNGTIRPRTPQHSTAVRAFGRLRHHGLISSIIGSLSSGHPAQDATHRVILRTLIQSFRNHATGTLFNTGQYRRFGLGQRQALQKLRMLDAARQLSDLAALPGNRLELLQGDRSGQHSIRINDQFRVCFVWSEGHIFDVEIVDYH